MQLSLRGFQLAGLSLHCPQLLPCWDRLWHCHCFLGYVSKGNKSSVKELEKRNGRRQEAISQNEWWRSMRGPQKKGKGEEVDRKSPHVFSLISWGFFQHCFSPLSFLLPSIPSYSYPGPPSQPACNPAVSESRKAYSIHLDCSKQSLAGMKLVSTN